MELTVPAWLEPLVAPGVVAAVLGWAGIRLVKRVDELEREKVEKADFQAFIDELRADRREAREGREKLYGRVNRIAEELARLQGVREGEQHGRGADG